MDERDIRQFLEAVKSGQLSAEDALKRLRDLPFRDLGFAKIDHHRALRQGYPEVIFARGKTPRQVTKIVAEMLRANASHNILVTRADEKVFRAVRQLVRSPSSRSAGGSSARKPPAARTKKSPQAEFNELSRTIAIHRTRAVFGKGLILVVTAGTSDIPVAEEALVTARAMGNRVEAIYDVGVAGLHRLLEHREKLREARVIVCVAGMEGALPSVLGGLVASPVIAVPASTGYGASFGGLAALLGMLNSCASNVSVVNIDNGFGAGCVASVINRA
jgi:pyridinium-3,5-biscarboxylic acid mononucleotide synthase